MKKLILILLLASTLTNAQESPIIAKKNEFRIDLLSIITYGKFGVSYERFLNKDFSTGINVNFSNNQKTKDNFDQGFRNNLPLYEINPYFRYKMSVSPSKYYFAEIFASSNGGDYKEITRLVDSNNNGYYTTEKTKYTDFALGGSLGYKMYFREKIALEFIVGFGKNLINRAKSPDVITRVSINLGYRF